MRALLLTLLLGMVAGRLGEWDCRGCTTLIHQECMSFDIGEDCIPDNYEELVRDLKLYRTFYYLEDTVILSVRCLDYGISIKHVPGLPVNSTITRNTFDLLYNSYFTRDCENWSFAPYTTNNKKQIKHINSTPRF